MEAEALQSTADGPEVRVIELLRQRNARAAAALEATRGYQALLRDCTALEAQARTCDRLQHEALAAKAAEAQAAEAAKQMGEKLEAVGSNTADLEHTIAKLTASEAALKSENERLLVRLTEQLQMQALAMDSEREQHEQRLEAVAAAGKPPEGFPAAF